MTPRFVDPDRDSPSKRLAREIEAREEALGLWRGHARATAILERELDKLRREQRRQAMRQQEEEP